MIELKNVTKYFKTNGNKKYILKNVNFTIPSGINLGILGRNGAGKSTFLRMLGGIEFPTSGEITSKNSFSWPMGLSGGFQTSMTGRQNVKFVARIYGKTERQMNEIITYVRKFSELGDFFDMPIKTYSSGMRSRLSFGLSLAFDFDYLIIDETLSVGDENFKKKAKEALLKKIEACNILLVSHSMTDLKQLCDAGVVLHNGILHYFDNIDDAIGFYHDINMNQPKKVNGKAQSSAIYCDDGNIFDNVKDAAAFYKVRPMSILQALNQNDGSNVYLKKVFWRDGQMQRPYHDWKNIVSNETIMSSDGIIFPNAYEAGLFYRERFPNKITNEQYVDNVLKTKNGFSEELNMNFYYLSEYNDE